MKSDKATILVLEDNAERIARFRELFPNATITSSAPDCIKRIKSRQYMTVYLDHDLNQEAYVDSQRDDCGMEVVRFLESRMIRNSFAMLVRVYVHSHNEPAAKAMVLALQRAGYKAQALPFGRGEGWQTQ